MKGNERFNALQHLPGRFLLGLLALLALVVQLSFERLLLSPLIVRPALRLLDALPFQLAQASQLLNSEKEKVALVTNADPS